MKPLSTSDFKLHDLNTIDYHQDLH